MSSPEMDTRFGLETRGLINIPGIQFTKAAKRAKYSFFSEFVYPTAVIVDGTRDISGIEQESICIRYVSEDLVPTEVFLDFYEVEVTTENNIAQVVHDATI